MRTSDNSSHKVVQNKQLAWSAALFAVVATLAIALSPTMAGATEPADIEPVSVSISSR